MGTRGPVALRLAPAVDPEAAVKVEAKGGTAAAMVRPAAPPKPAKLPAGGSEVWDELVTALEEAGLIAQCDGPTLELAIRHYLAAVKASNTLMASGTTRTDKKNQRVMKNPASQVFRDHSTAFLEFAKQLGLTFVARARTQVGAEEGSDSGNPFA